MDRHSGLPYQPALDGLRALAVGAVIAYHLGAGWGRGGFLGVDAFFVLSGFLITSLLLTDWGSHGRINLVRFWVRRARRLLPALFLVLGAIAVYAATLAPASQLRTLRADGLASLFYFANWRFVLSGASYFDVFTLPSPMRHLWSLAIEEQFYLVWPLVVLGCLWLGRGSRRLLAAVCLAGIAASVAVSAILYEPLDPSRAYYGTDARAHTLLVGALLALLLARRGGAERRLHAPTAVHVLGLAAAGGVVWAWTNITDDARSLYYGGSLLFALAVAALIASAVQPGGPLRVVLSLPALVWMGRISYGLYLWHWPVIVVLTEQRTGVSGASLTVIRLAATLSAAALSFYLVEQPIRRGALRAWRGRIAVPIGFATAAVTIMVATVGASAESPLERTRVGETFSAPAASARASQRSTPRPGVAAPPSRILLVGDSVPASLVPDLQSLGAERGVTFDAALVAGCHEIGGVAIYLEEEAPPHGTECPEVAKEAEQAAFERGPPDVILWMSTWDFSEDIEESDRMAFGTAVWDGVMLDKIDRAARHLVARGAHLVITTMAPRPPNELGPQAGAAETSRYVRLNELYRQYARAHHEAVSVVDFAGVVCPGGPPCPRTVDGVDPRPVDGVHFSPESARWAARWLIDAVTECRRTPDGSLCPAHPPVETRSKSAHK